MSDFSKNMINADLPVPQASIAKALGGSGNIADVISSAKKFPFPGATSVLHLENLSNADDITNVVAPKFLAFLENLPAYFVETLGDDPRGQVFGSHWVLTDGTEITLQASLTAIYLYLNQQESTKQIYWDAYGTDYAGGLIFEASDNGFDVSLFLKTENEELASLQTSVMIETDTDTPGGETRIVTDELTVNQEAVARGLVKSVDLYLI